MSKRGRDEGMQDFQNDREYYDNLMKEMEADPKFQDQEIPEEWDRAFRKIIQETLEENWRKKKRRRVRAVAAAACAVMVVGIAMNTAREVHGEGLLKVFQKTFESDGSKYITYGTTEDYGMASEEESTVVFEGATLTEVFSQMKAELKRPFFQWEDVWGESIVEKAKYDKAFDMIQIELRTSEGMVYTSQEIFLEESGAGDLIGECIDTVYNKNLGHEIEIYKSEQEGFYVFSIQEGQTIFSFNGKISLDGCKKMAENVWFE